MANNEPIGLKELIAQVKYELLEPHDYEQPLFVVESVELQISFTAERNANGGVDLKIIQAGASAKTTDVQIVTVTLQPIITVDEVRKSLTTKQLQAASKGVTRSDTSTTGSTGVSRSG